MFCILYVLHGMLTESSYELLAFVVTTFIVLVYVVANFFSTPKITIKIVSFLILYTSEEHEPENLSFKLELL